LSDPDGIVHREYGAWGEKTLYGKKSEGVIRTTVVVDEKGKVLKAHSNVKAEGHAGRVLGEL
jgi:peroxiredoxin Q/BCP